MHSVKIEFCPLDWYSSSPTTIVLYKKMRMCKVFPSNRKKLKKRKCDLHEISSASPKAVVLNRGEFSTRGEFCIFKGGIISGSQPGDHRVIFGGP